MLKGIIGAKIDPSNPSKKMYLVEWAGVDAISGNPWKLEDSTWYVCSAGAQLMAQGAIGEHP